MSSCCTLASGAAAQHFNGKRAHKELSAYRDTGPGPTTRGLLQGLSIAGAHDGSVLDVGSGIGALTFELLSSGFGAAMCVDMSPAFLQAGKGEAERRGLAERISWHQADFVAIAASVPPAEVVTLDRVVCCYPSYAPLLEQAAAHSRRFLAMSYPHDRWYVRVMLWGENLLRRLRGDGFRAFVHPATAMEELLREIGFRPVHRTATLAWRMDVFRRVRG